MNRPLPVCSLLALILGFSLLISPVAFAHDDHEDEQAEGNTNAAAAQLPS